MEQPNKITIEVTVHAPIARVWECFTDPKHITKWNSASSDWHTPSATNDLRAGGNFNFRMEARDGSMGFDFAGTYTDVTLHKHIAYSFGDRTAEIDFTEQDGAVLVRETFDPETENPIEMQREGWQSILNNFARYTEELPQ